ncbi:MAG: hypothetical protein OXI63_01625 [Candidatus Poribacteria bacterium]|nr:hypothetical protein [Candidatus Poribacteria bacterium]
MRKPLSLRIFLFIFGIVFLGFGAAVSVERFSLASSPGDPPPKEESVNGLGDPTNGLGDLGKHPSKNTPTQDDGSFYAEIEYQHDIDTARDYRLNVRVHPGGVWPGVTGGGIETIVWCQVQLRGVSVPLSCDTSAQRAGRPLKEIERERERWDASIEYTWSLLKLQKQVRLANPIQIAPGVVECDVAFPLGGAWHDLASALTSDEHARIELIDGHWNWGSLHVKPY